jgi:hypothetical protein
VINSELQNFHVPRPAASFARQTPASPGFAAFGGMPGAFCTGIVKNQQGSAAEPLHTGICESNESVKFITIP